MTKTELATQVAEKTGSTKKAAEEAVDAVFASIQDELAVGGKVSIIGFGTFDVRERAARTGRNPQSGEPMEIAASKAVGFKAGKGLKDAVDKK